MKTILIAFCLMVASLSAERDFRPVGRMENIPAQDASIQQCYIIRTIPGVVYRVESSHDLSAWTAGDEFYGLGHEYAVAMREFTPPPPPPPGDGGNGQFPLNPTAPARLIGLRMLPSSGVAGGSVISWRSLDSDAPVNMLMAQEMATDWNSMPFFCERYGTYYFCIGCGGMTPIPPPAQNPTLGPKDAAMFAQLETSFPAMNQAVIESTARARNSPPPAPPDPLSRKFWRVFCDWGLDTDEDGSPDWMEFEMAALTTGDPTPPLRGDAFDDDTNHDGIPDGEELDYDQDGVADAKDAGKDDASATFPIGPAPRYALFPITNAAPDSLRPHPLQISDRGTVLYRDGTWTGGNWTSLNRGAGQVKYAYAVAINDLDQILGYDTEPGSNFACYWASPAGQPTPVEVGNVRAALWPDGTERDNFDESLLPGPMLANDGGFYAPAAIWGGTPENRHAYFQHHSRWKIPNNGQPASETQAGRGTRCSSDSSGYALRWGYDEALTNPKGLILFGGYSYPCPFAPTNVSVLPNKKEKQLLAMSMDKDVPAQVRYDNTWHADTIYSQAIDISKDGIAIGKAPEGKSSPILINGKWTENEKYAPGLTGGWETGISLLDTTPGGWVLAKHQPASGAAQFGALLSIRLNGVDPDYTPPTVEPGQPVPEPPDFFAGGVDHLTARAESGDGYVPELWIMAPIAGSTTVRWRSPLNSASKLKPECGKAVFNPQEITATAGNVAVSGNDLVADENADVTDFSATLKLGYLQENPTWVTSLTTPVRLKRMKKRAVNVALHYVYSVDKDGVSALPFYQPTKLDLELYLNRVFGPQVNVNFVVTPFTEGSATAGIDFDLDNDERLETAIEEEVNAATPNAQIGATGSSTNIDVWVIGGGTTLKFATGGIHGSDLSGWTRADGKKVIIDGNQASYASVPNNGQMKSIHHTIAHEIGHVMTGIMSHPSQGAYKWNLEWTTHYDPYLRKRLMCPGNKNLSNADLLGTCLIKKEWDAIEEWLHLNVDPKLQ